MKYKIVIIDDESRTQSLLKKMIDQSDYPLEVVGDADSVSTGLKAIHKHEPDIVLLDIQMPDGSGFDVLDKISQRTFEVVFVTAHQEFAIRAIKFSALDYILKPVELEELNSALGNAIDTIQTKSDLSVKYETLLENIKNDYSQTGHWVVIFHHDNDITHCSSHNRFSQS